VLREGGAHIDLPDDSFLDLLLKATFGLTARKAVSVNIFLPDVIFVRRGTNKVLADFTYDLRINVLAQAREFSRTVIGATSHAIQLLGEFSEPKYTYVKKAIGAQSKPQRSSRPELKEEEQ